MHGMEERLLQDHKRCGFVACGVLLSRLIGKISRCHTDKTGARPRFALSYQRTQNARRPIDRITTLCKVYHSTKY